VQVRPGTLVVICVGGHKLAELPIKEIPDYPTTPDVTVPANSVYVMGDNRNNNGDSACLGFVLRRGIIVRRSNLLAPQRLSIVPHYSYSEVGNGP